MNPFPLNFSDPRFTLGFKAGFSGATHRSRIYRELWLTLFAMISLRLKGIKQGEWLGIDHRGGIELQLFLKGGMIAK